MIVADTEPHGHGWRWFLVDLETGERPHIGGQAYTSRDFALRIGERVLLASPPEGTP